jgi:hypothetical protein
MDQSSGIYDVALISLDNDLDMVPAEHGRYVDAGDGIEVSKWLITRPPVVPVLVHTTNTPAGDQIDKLLHAHGWFHDRVVPYDGEAWISEVWRSSVRRLIVTHAPEATVSSAGVTVLKHGLQTGLPILDLRMKRQAGSGWNSGPNDILEIRQIQGTHSFMDLCGSRILSP